MHPTALFPSWFSHIPLDWIGIVALALLITFDALRSGSGRASALALALPIAAFLSSLIPHTYLIGNVATSLSNPFAQAGIFLVFFVLTYLFTSRITATLAGVPDGFLPAVLSGLSATIVVIVTALQVPALQALWHFNSLVQTIFGAGFALFWLLLAYLILAFVRS